MLRIVILGLLLILLTTLIWIVWAEVQAFRRRRERDRHDHVGG